MNTSMHYFDIIPSEVKYTIFNQTPYESHTLVLSKIRNDSSVLDLGCATGYFDSELVKKNCEVYGVDIDSHAIRKARKFCKKTAVLDLEKIHDFPFKKKLFDYILMLDLIEHIGDPKKLLITSKKYLKKDGMLIISTPNIAFISIRLALLRGKFEYTHKGIMDETHVKFFTENSLKKILTNSKLKIMEIDGSSGFSQITLIGRYLNLIPKKIQYEITKRYRKLLAYQFIAVCTQ